MKIASQKWCIISVYRSEQITVDIFLKQFSKSLDMVLDEYENVAVIGDLNINSLKKHSHFDKAKFNKLKTFCDTYDFSNLIKGPTCFQSDDPSSIDVILTNKNRSFIHSKSIMNGLSDHHSFVCTMLKTTIKKLKPTKINYRSFKNFNEKYFLVDLENKIKKIDFSKPKNDFTKFSVEFEKVTSKHAPIKSKIVRGNDAPFITAEFRKEIRHRSKLCNIARKQKTPMARLAYRKQRNKCTRIKREIQKAYFANVTKDIGGKRFWKTIGPYMNDKGNHGNEDYILEENGELIKEPNAVGDIFCEYYTNIVEQTTGTPPIQIPISENSDLIDDILNYYKDHKSIRAIENMNIDQVFKIPFATEQDISDIIKNLNTSKANGIDNISAKLVKSAAEIISAPLCIILNHCIKKGKFPNNMKIARITPLYKKGTRLEKECYRPVSVLPCFSKIFERYILNAMLSHANSILSDKISAYRQGYSCQHVLLKLTDEWRRYLDKNLIVGAVLMDLSKAFDCLPHELLIAKLAAYGFDKNTLNFFHSYLKERKQAVSINGNLSNFMEILAGVPQGSILGPVLFNIFLNDMMFIFEKTCINNFADDNTLSTFANSTEQLVFDLEEDSGRAIDWFKNNHMIANPEKFKAIIINRNRNEAGIMLKINGDTIQSLKEVNLLGITIDNKLSFSIQIEHLCKSAAKLLNSIKRLQRNFDQNTKCLMAKSFVMSQFNYCPLVWHFCKPGDTHKMERIHERALRFIYNDYTTNYTELLLNNGESALYLKRVRTMAHEIYKAINDISPKYSKEMLSFRSNPMRRPLDLYVPRVNQITFGYRSYAFEAPSLWNSLPIGIRKAENFKLFKALMKIWTGPSCRCGVCKYTGNYGSNED